MTREVKAGDLVLWERVPVDSLVEMQDGYVYLRRAMNGWTVTNVRLSKAHVDDEPMNGGGWEWIGNESDGNAKILAMGLAPSLEAGDLRRLVWSGRKVETWDRVPDGALVRTAAGMWVVRRGKEFKIVRDSSLTEKRVDRDRISDPATSVGATDVVQAEQYTRDLRPWKAPFEIYEVRPDGWTRDAIHAATNDRESTAATLPALGTVLTRWEDVPVGGLVRSKTAAWFVRDGDEIRIVCYGRQLGRVMVRTREPEDLGVFFGSLDEAERTHDTGAKPPLELVAVQDKWTREALQAAVDVREGYLPPPVVVTSGIVNKWADVPIGGLIRSTKGAWFLKFADGARLVARWAETPRDSVRIEIDDPPENRWVFDIERAIRQSDDGALPPYELHGVQAKWTPAELQAAVDARDKYPRTTERWGQVPDGCLVRTSAGLWAVRRGDEVHAVRGHGAAGRAAKVVELPNLGLASRYRLTEAGLERDRAWARPLELHGVRPEWTQDEMLKVSNARELAKLHGWDTVHVGALVRTAKGTYIVRDATGFHIVRGWGTAGRRIASCNAIGYADELTALDAERRAMNDEGWHGPIEVIAVSPKWSVGDLTNASNDREVLPEGAKVAATTTVDRAYPYEVAKWEDAPDGALGRCAGGAWGLWRSKTIIETRDAEHAGKEVELGRIAFGVCRKPNDPRHLLRPEWKGPIEIHGVKSRPSTWEREEVLRITNAREALPTTATLKSVKVGDEVKWADAPTDAMVQRTHGGVFVRRGDCGWCLGVGRVAEPEPTIGRDRWSWTNRTRHEGPVRIVALDVPLDLTIAQLQAVLDTHRDVRRIQIGDAVLGSGVPSGALVRRVLDGTLFVRIGDGGWEVGEGDVVSLSLPPNVALMWPWTGKTGKESEQFVLLAEAIPEFAARDVLQARLDVARPRPGDSVEWAKVPLGAVVCDDNGWLYARVKHDELADVAYEHPARGTALRGLDALELYGGAETIRWDGGAVWLPQSGLERPAFATVIMLGAGADTSGDVVRKAWASVRTVDM